MATALLASASGYITGNSTVQVNHNPRPYQNPNNPWNVNDDPEGLISPLDVLLIINEINRSGAGTLPRPTAQPEFFVDVSLLSQLASARSALSTLDNSHDRFFALLGDDV